MRDSTTAPITTKKIGNPGLGGLCSIEAQFGGAAPTLQQDAVPPAAKVQDVLIKFLTRLSLPKGSAQSLPPSLFCKVHHQGKGSARGLQEVFQYVVLQATVRMLT
jgi:hypothetical protein